MHQTNAKSILSAFALIVISAVMSAGAQEISSFSALAEQGRSSFKPLSQEQAFPFHVSETGEKRFLVTWQPTDDHYLYKRAFKFTYHQSASSSPKILPFSLPAGLAKNDEFFGEVEVYYSPLNVSLELPQLPSNGAFLVIEYQGCADWGFCYPPQSARFNF